MPIGIKVKKKLPGQKSFSGRVNKERNFDTAKQAKKNAQMKARKPRPAPMEPVSSMPKKTVTKAKKKK